jgi:hypothetical protein
MTSPDEPSPAELPSPLDQVVDDDTPRIEAVKWAVEELYADREFDDVAASLVEGGWSEDAAAEIVEEARRQTRGHRGVFTRDQVVADANRLYSRATARWYVGMPMLGAAWRLLHSLATLLALRRAGRDTGRHEPRRK